MLLVAQHGARTAVVRAIRSTDIAGWHVSAATVIRWKRNRTAIAAGLVCLVGGTTRPTVIFVVFNTRPFAVGPPVLGLATRCSAKSIQLCSELRLRLDKTATVVTHRLIASVWVLRHQGDDGSDQNYDEKDRGENSVVDKENDTHDASDDILCHCQREV